MIRIKVKRGAGAISISVRGHANFDLPGKDIICAAVSAIVQTAILGLKAIADRHPDHVSFTQTSDTVTQTTRSSS